MKKAALLLLLPVLLFSFSCKKEPVIDDGYVKPIYFSVKDSITMTFPSLIGVNLPVDLPIVPVNTEFDSEGDEVNPLIDLVKEVRLNSVDMEIIDPPGLTFDFLKDVTIYMNAPGQNEIVFATLFNVPDNPGNKLTLVPGLDVLDDYVKQDYSLRISVVADRAIFQDIQVKSVMDLDVELINY